MGSNPRGQVVPWGLHQVYDNTQEAVNGAICIDIIAVHGLGAHPDHAWVHHGKTTDGTNVDTKWLIDLLPESLRSHEPSIAIRVFYFSYESAWMGKSLPKNRLRNVATRLLDKISGMNTQQANLPERPILFLGHSFGGLVIEQAVVIAGSVGSSYHNSFTKRLGGVVLFGTPHRESKAQKWGMIMAHLSQMIDYGDSIMIDEMNDDSMKIFDLRFAFMQLIYKLGLVKAVFCFCENKKTSYARRAGKIGTLVDVPRSGSSPKVKWSDRTGLCLRGPGVVLARLGLDISLATLFIILWTVVDETSAVLDGVDYLLLDSDHLKLNKFTGVEDKNYTVVAANIARIAMEAHASFNIRIQEADGQSPPQTYYMVSRQRVRHFLGRESELADILAYFSSSSIPNPRVLIIHAMGGQGKSQLAIEYCQRAKKMQTYRGIFWVNASSEALMLESYRFILQKIDPLASATLPQDLHEIADRLVQELSLWNDRWLMVFDNFDDPRKFPRFREYVPNSDNGDMLVTSRHSALDRIGQTMPLSSLPPEAAIDLLLHGFNSSIIKPKHRDMATQIINRLGSLALAIDQAAAYIRHRLIQLDDLEEFLVLYENHRKTILKHVPEDFWEYSTEQFDSDINHSRAISAFTTWEMSFQQLLATSGFESLHVERFLSTAAFLSPVQVEQFLYWFHAGAVQDLGEGQWLLKMFCSDGDSDEDTTHNSDHENDVLDLSNEIMFSCERYWALVAKLQTLSLVEKVQKGDENLGIIFQLHPLIRDWIQIRRGWEEQSECLQDSINIITSCVLFATYQSHMERRRHIVKHVATCLENYRRFCQSPPLTGRHAAHGWSFPFKAIWNFYYAQHFYKQSAYLCYLELESNTEALGDSDPSSVEITYRLAQSLELLGMYEEAEKLIKANITLGIDTLGETHPTVLESMILLADIMNEKGQHDEAIIMIRKAFKLGEGILSNRLMINATVLFCRIFHRRNEDHVAEKLLREILQITATLQTIATAGDEQNVYAHTLSLLLAQCIITQKRYPEAEILIRQHLAQAVRIWGEQHPNTLSLMRVLANALLLQNKTEAIETLESVVRLAKEHFGPDHPEVREHIEHLNIAVDRFSVSEQDHDMDGNEDSRDTMNSVEERA